MSDLCPNCFSQKQIQENCPVCNYEYKNAYINTSALPPMTLLKNRYLLGKTLGIGGFGITYLALDTVTNRKCAIKEFMPSEIAIRNVDGRVYSSSRENEEIFIHCKEGFINEARTLYRFNEDPTIVNVLDYFSEKNTAYLVMEFLEGCTMKAQMRKMGGKVPYETATVMLVTIGSALMAVHGKNILHRDLSPENIFYTNNNEYRLIDFGAARFFTSEKNKSLSIMLKPGFAPPEQYSTRGNQGPWTDVYGLAATYYYLISGVKAVDTMDRLSGKEMPTLHELCPQVPLKTSRAVARAMELNYKNRYFDVVSFLNDVDVSCINSMSTNIQSDNISSNVNVNTNIGGKKHSFEVVKTIFTRKSKVPPPKAKNNNPILKCFCGTSREYDFEIEPNKQIKIGRSNTSDIIITDDLNISRLHCSLIFNPDNKKLYIQDFSSNGTFLFNGTPVPKGAQYEVQSGFYLSEPKNSFKLYINN